jgi:hypothetical protein
MRYRYRGPSWSSESCPYHVLAQSLIANIASVTSLLDGPVCDIWLALSSLSLMRSLQITSLGQLYIERSIVPELNVTRYRSSLGPTTTFSSRYAPTSVSFEVEALTSCFL